MKFNTIGELFLWLKKYNSCFLDRGSQGVCYKKGNKVYKIFHQFIDIDDDEFIVYGSEDILKFSSIVNNTYIFPNDIIYVGDTVVGYITDYVDARNLDSLNPLMFDLDRFELDLKRVYVDTEIISNFGVCSYDVLYNIMYGEDGFKIIDTFEYSKSLINKEQLVGINRYNFNVGVQLFLIDGFFDDFINSSLYLRSLYEAHNVDVVIFLNEFRKALSIAEGFEISKLSDARKSLKLRKSEYKYIRDLYY